MALAIRLYRGIRVVQTRDTWTLEEPPNLDEPGCESIVKQRAGLRQPKPLRTHLGGLNSVFVGSRAC
jgi:hypothetical protein